MYCSSFIQAKVVLRNEGCLGDGVRFDLVPGLAFARASAFSRANLASAGVAARSAAKSLSFWILSRLSMRRKCSGRRDRLKEKLDDRGPTFLVLRRAQAHGRLAKSGDPMGHDRRLG